MLFLDNVAAWTALTIIYIYNYLYTNCYVLVEIDKGVLRGRNATTWRGANYFSFKGIPYARPPVGELRFKAPREEAAWDGIRDAVVHGEVCPHVDMAFRIFRGREDCLFINVYTPSLRDERLPVMFFIHGGMFMLASGNDELYGPDYFMEAGNVVLVTINYRLGALGFLSTGDDLVPGNAGLKDQVAALRWVQRNIANFGGDPDGVTLFGGSSGAACVEYHLLSPMSKGLFSKAIAQSGSAMNTWGLTENGAEVTVRLAKALGLDAVSGDTTTAMKFLKTAPCEDIVGAQGTLMTTAEKRLRVGFLFTPSVERGVKSGEVFLPDSPLKILESGNFNKVPYMTGYTSQEGHFFMREVEQPEFMLAAIEDTERYVPIDIRDKRIRMDLAKSIRKFYFDDKPIGNENISNLIDLYSDTTFVAGIGRSVRLHLRSKDAPIYVFVFSHDDTMNLVKFFVNIDCPGAVHGDELGYLFHQRLLPWKNPMDGSSNEYMVDTMIRLWTNFAKYGNPTPPGDPLTWKPATVGEFNYLNISGRDTHLAENPHPERADFWANAYGKSSAPRTDVCFQQTGLQYEHFIYQYRNHTSLSSIHD